MIVVILKRSILIHSSVIVSFCHFDLFLNLNSNLEVILRVFTNLVIVWRLNRHLYIPAFPDFVLERSCFFIKESA